MGVLGALAVIIRWAISFLGGSRKHRIKCTEPDFLSIISLNGPSCLYLGGGCGGVGGEVTT